jgi:glycosyltransferase involved in cell wall biosynthesis
MNVGIVASEFFAGPGCGRMGGFGWAARQVAALFRSRPALGVQVVYLAAGARHVVRSCGSRIHDTPILGAGREKISRRRIRSAAPDVLLSIDYRKTYLRVFDILADAPIVVWVRDPRTPQLQKKVDSLRLPGAPSVIPHGTKAVECRSLAAVLERRARMGVQVVFGTPAPSLGAYLPAVYGCRDDTCVPLPNVVRPVGRPVTKSRTPVVVFLGRLDPVKRPWLFVDLAKRFASVQFLMLGQSHFEGPRTWTPAHLPRNVQLLGHVDGARKDSILTSAWVLINTSIHEGLATSYLESLAFETPIVSCTDVEAVASRFGIAVENPDGDGVAALPSLTDALQRMLDDHAFRSDRGRDGRRWVEETHSAERFLAAFDRLCAAAGVRAPCH